MPMSRLRVVQERVVGCRLCPRLVAHCEQTAETKVRRFQEWDYWGRPLPGFGDARARLLIVGMAPAAQGGNRTGWTFTGDRSGDWLYGALHSFDFARHSHSVSQEDAICVWHCYLTYVVK